MMLAKEIKHRVIDPMAEEPEPEVCPLDLDHQSYAT